MKKPIVNVDELRFSERRPGFPGKFAPVSALIGAKKLGYNISICPTGKTICPFHNHRINEEMFFVLEGEGILRFGDQEFPLRKFDFIPCPPGGREVAHQMINTGKADLKYLAMSTMVEEEICEYPDSDKVGIFLEKEGSMDYRKLFKASQDVPYMDGESSEKLSIFHV